MKASGYSPLYCPVYSVLQKRELVEEWLGQCEFSNQYLRTNKATFEYSGDFSFIPEGTNAFVHTYSLQRDPRYFFPLPDSFLPERWLSQEQRLALEPRSSILRKSIYTTPMPSFLSLWVQPIVPERTLHGWRCAWRLVL